MKSWLALLTSLLLLLWMQTAFVSCQEPSIVQIIEQPDGIKLSCQGNYKLDGKEEKELHLKFMDENSGEYKCLGNTKGSNPEKIYVKFRTCDNCIELDVGSIVGIVLGNLVATAVVGVAVYLIASVTRTGPAGPPKKKSSDRQLLVPNEGSSRGTNDHYQPLRARQVQTYDVLKT
ncbi:T-cell surface glycoprotein CD3 gamma chain isoform X2 [Parambassis ranga]|uniref:T-cell surface glycoprotein CD3 gamma chain isoform X2 n=1 Tax=Parambassis ranga TaxID=210632 RepID=A0A6P7JDX1_9TELE|nr:T-cell surface glycoprotein CD3 gamma chain isoform X2 [Parambassis ranga]